MASQIDMSNRMRPIQHPVRLGDSYTIGKGGVSGVSRSSRYAQLVAALTTLCALCIAVSACGGDSGPSKQAGGSATDTAKAYIAAWEANDSASIDALLTPDAKSSWAMVGGPARWLSGKAESRGAPIPGKGMILRLTESGGTAQADVGVAYDCKNLKGSTCPQDELPDWAPPGSSVSADHLTLQRQADNRWLITYVDSSSYFAQAKQATQQAVAQLTQAAIPTYTPVPTWTPIPPTPTFTPTPVPVHTTAKAAYTEGGVADALSKWSNDAILFRVWDRTRDNTWPFDYDPSRYVIRPGLFADVSEPYIDGDGTSRQWLFFAASTTRKEVMVVRVRDGKWDRQDVSASLYRDLFAAQGIVPQPVDIATALDSDEVVKIAREHGYRVQNLDDMYVQLSSEDRKSYSGYKPSEPNWAVFGEMGKAIVVKPDTGEIVQNDF
jgi:hypothetical protein